MPQCNTNTKTAKRFGSGKGENSVHQIHHQNLLYKLLRIIRILPLHILALPLSNHLPQLFRRYGSDFPRGTQCLVFIGRPSQTVEEDEEWTQESDSAFVTDHGHGGPGEDGQTCGGEETMKENC